MQDLLLYVVRKQIEIHDLRQSGTAYVSNACQFGLVDDLPTLDQMIETDGEGHHLGNARYAAWRGLLWLRSSFDDRLGASLTGLEIQLVFGG